MQTGPKMKHTWLNTLTILSTNEREISELQIFNHILLENYWKQHKH